MTMKKITTAAEITDRVFSHIHAARRLMDETFINGYGVLSSPKETRADLRKAIKHLALARVIICSNEWPTETEYDADSLARRQAAGELEPG